MSARVESLRPRFLPDRDALREWGGKGAALARLIRKGYAVPPTAAMGLTQVQGWLTTLPEHAPAIEAWRRWPVDAEGRETAPPLLEALRQAVLSAPMPAHWEASAATLRSFLCGDGADETQPWPMILRSSMSVEDGAHESLAGCFESVVARDTSPRGLWDAFVRVVASAFAGPSAERLLAAGVDPAAFRAGVVIQPYLVAELAGVCFSRDPRDPWDRDGVLEWVRGAGEALMLGTGDARLRRRSEGPEPEVAPFWDALWKKVERAEKLVGGPADVEWVWDGQQLWFVQARPIATEEARLAARAPGRRWTRELTLERFPEPMTPLGWSAIQDAFVGNLGTLDRRFGVVARVPLDVAACVRGVVYSDPRFFSFPGGVRVRWSRHLNPLGATPWRLLGALARAAGRALARADRGVSAALLKLDVADALLGGEARRIEAGWSRHRDEGMERLERLGATLAPMPRGPERILERMSALSAVSSDFMEPDLAVYLIKDTLGRCLLALWSALGEAPSSFSDLFRSFAGNRTLEMNAEWSAFVRALRGDSGRDAFLAALEQAHDPEAGAGAGAALSEPARAAWVGFLRRNGHSTTSWDLAAPTWSEDPARLAPLLRASVAAGESESRGIAPSALREEARARLRRALAERFSPGAGRRVLEAVERLETFMRIDEEHHFLSGALLVPSRKLVLAGGEALRALGLLEARDDVFFVSLAELKRALAEPARAASLRFVARRRRSEWERARASKPPYELPRPRLPAPVPDARPGRWQGVPMSPGVVTGRVVVAEHIDQVRGIEPGTILVTTSPNPALTPIYPLLGGLISVTGSSLSHGFVSAREYALPAVSGIAGAVEDIPSGALVRVDGTTGHVELLA